MNNGNSIFAELLRLNDENAQLKLLIQKMFGGLDDYWITTEEGMDICREARNCLKGNKNNESMDS